MARLMLGALVYGDNHIEVFEHYCVASMQSAANLAALRANGARITLFTNAASIDRLKRIRHALPVAYGVVPDHLFQHDKYVLLAAVHADQLKAAKNEGMAFHMLVADELYSENYFPRLFALATEHGTILHSGINANLDGTAAELRPFRQPDGTLAIPAKPLADIAWRHVHGRMSQCVLNDSHVPRDMPLTHFFVWRCDDRVMIFSPHNTPVYLAPEDAYLFLDNVTGTLDAMTHRIPDFYAPSLDDDMTLVGLETGPAKELERVDWQRFALGCLGQAKSHAAVEAYYRRPSGEYAVAHDASAPSAAEIGILQSAMADALLRGVA